MEKEKGLVSEEPRPDSTPLHICTILNSTRMTSQGIDHSGHRWTSNFQSEELPVLAHRANLDVYPARQDAPAVELLAVDGATLPVCEPCVSQKEIIRDFFR